MQWAAALSIILMFTTAFACGWQSCLVWQLHTEKARKQKFSRNFNLIIGGGEAEDERVK